MAGRGRGPCHLQIFFRSSDFGNFNASSENFQTYAVSKDKGFEAYLKIIELGSPILQVPRHPWVSAWNEFLLSMVIVHMGSSSVHVGSSSVHMGSSSVHVGSSSVHMGSSSVHMGSSSVHMGSSSVHMGSSSVHVGSSSVFI